MKHVYFILKFLALEIDWFAFYGSNQNKFTIVWGNTEKKKKLFWPVVRFVANKTTNGLVNQLSQGWRPAGILKTQDAAQLQKPSVQPAVSIENNW